MYQRNNSTLLGFCDGWLCFLFLHLYWLLWSLDKHDLKSNPYNQIPKSPKYCQMPSGKWLSDMKMWGSLCDYTIRCEPCNTNSIYHKADKSGLSRSTEFKLGCGILSINTDKCRLEAPNTIQETLGFRRLAIINTDLTFRKQQLHSGFLHLAHHMMSAIDRIRVEEAFISRWINRI